VRASFRSPILVEDLNAGFIYRARMVNYSKKGIFIETDVILDPGEEIHIGMENSPYKLSSDASGSYRAKVIWQKGEKASQTILPQNSFFHIAEPILSGFYLQYKSWRCLYQNQR